jgi:protoheme ferro-lyase
MAQPPCAEERVGVLLLNLGGPETLEDVEPFLYNLFADDSIIRLPSYGERRMFHSLFSRLYKDHVLASLAVQSCAFALMPYVNAAAEAACCRLSSPLEPVTLSQLGMGLSEAASIIVSAPCAARFLQRPLAKVISTLRAPKSSEGYKRIGGGSPLRRITEEQAQALAQALKQKGLDARVYVGMRYWAPFIEDAMQQVLATLFLALCRSSLYVWAWLARC